VNILAYRRLFIHPWASPWFSALRVNKIICTFPNSPKNYWRRWPEVIKRLSTFTGKKDLSFYRSKIFKELRPLKPPEITSD